jgi:RimJ/RimL family protein N-acetyltransferase
MSMTSHSSANTEQKRTQNWAAISLTPLDDADADLIFAWQNAPRTRDLTMGFRFPIQKQRIFDWIKARRESNGSKDVAYAVRENGAAVGIVQLHGLDQFQRKASLSIYIGDTTRRSAGIGYVACALILDFAFMGLDLRKVGLEVLSANVGAVKLYERLGFVLEGCKTQEYFLDGKYWDSSIFGLHRASWNVSLPAGANRLIHSIEI